MSILYENIIGKDIREIPFEIYASKPFVNNGYYLIPDCK